RLPDRLVAAQGRGKNEKEQNETKPMHREAPLPDRLDRRSVDSAAESRPQRRSGRGARSSGNRTSSGAGPVTASGTAAGSIATGRSRSPPAALRWLGIVFAQTAIGSLAFSSAGAHRPQHSGGATIDARD